MKKIIYFAVAFVMVATLCGGAVSVKASDDSSSVWDDWSRTSDGEEVGANPTTGPLHEARMETEARHFDRVFIVVIAIVGIGGIGVITSYSSSRRQIENDAASVRQKQQQQELDAQFKQRELELREQEMLMKNQNFKQPTQPRVSRNQNQVVTQQQFDSAAANIVNDMQMQKSTNDDLNIPFGL